MISPITPPDGGFPYTETNMEYLFPEPLNAITSIFFLILAGYWTYKLKGQIKQHPFLFACVLLLYVGGIGGTIYHGLRQWSFFIMMDWLPIALICISAGVYFLAKITRWYFAIGVIFVYVGLSFYLRNKIDIHVFININYAILAGLVLFPVLAYLMTTKFKNAIWVGLGLLSFIVALFFRIADKWDLVSVGTHFLWHVFGAVAAWSMFHYIYLINENKVMETRSIS